MEALVTTDWLARDMVAGDLRIVDASWHLPDTGRDARAEYEAGHIPGALFLDLGSLVDTAASVDNTLPPPDLFAARMQALGVGDGSRIVFYDDSAVKTSARAWFMARMFGASQVALLDGGLAKWKAEGRPLATGSEVQRPRHFTSWADRRNLRSKAEVIANLDSGREQVLDARAPARFAGAAPEPRPGLAAGHIPGALNVPYGSLFNPDGTWKDKPGIRAVFEDAGVDLTRPITTSCGSGVTACVLLFALMLIGIERAALYDGSWGEWGADPETPKARGTTTASV